MEKRLQLFLQSVRANVRPVALEEVEKSRFGSLDDLIEIDVRRSKCGVPFAEHPQVVDKEGLNIFRGLSVSIRRPN